MDKTIAEPLAFLLFAAGPLALLAVAVLGTILVRTAIRRAKTPKKKWAAGLVAAVIVILIPTWDVIVGRFQFTYLCATESGIQVNRRVKLGPEYRAVQFPDTHLEYDQMPIAKRYPYIHDWSENIAGPGNIAYAFEAIRDAQTGETLGTFTSYFWGGGWFEHQVRFQGAGGGSCGREAGGFKSLLEHIFERPL